MLSSSFFVNFREFSCQSRQSWFKDRFGLTNNSAKMGLKMIKYENFPKTLHIVAFLTVIFLVFQGWASSKYLHLHEKAIETNAIKHSFRQFCVKLSQRFCNRLKFPASLRRIRINLQNAAKSWLIDCSTFSFTKQLFAQKVLNSRNFRVKGQTVQEEGNRQWH